VPPVPPNKETAQTHVAHGLVQLARCARLALDRLAALIVEGALDRVLLVRSGGGGGVCVLGARLDAWMSCALLPRHRAPR